MPASNRFSGLDFVWPRVDQPYRFDQSREETVACEPGAPNAAYSIAWQMPVDDGKKLFAELKAHYEACAENNKKLPKFSSVFGMKSIEQDDGTKVAQITAKKRAMSNQGHQNKPPIVVDGSLQPLEDKAIWGGSKGDVRVLAFPATNPQDGTGGISLLLDAVVVREAVYGGAGLEDDFEADEPMDSVPSSTSNEDPFEQAEAASKKTEPAKKDELEDEMPF